MPGVAQMIIDKPLFQQYASLKIKIEESEQLLESLKPKVLAELQAAGVPIEISGTGKFSLSGRKTWAYSLNTQQKETALKEIKKAEEQSGAATFTETFFPSFSAEKESA